MFVPFFWDSNTTDEEWDDWFINTSVGIRL